MTNFGIEEDSGDPKEPAHLDYKYLKSYEGPLASQSQLEKGQSNVESDVAESKSLIKKPVKGEKPLISVERKKYGGIRMC